MAAVLPSPPFSMSDPESWSRIKGLFARAAEMEGPERGAFLDRELASEPKVREQVEALLEADAEASRFLEAGPAPAAEPGDGAHRWEGRSFGAYRVVRELGRGGMGVVLLARRADGRYEREVALKIVPAALVQGSLAERFRSEVRILAALDHPNVARLLDAGETPEGLAFLVMEYVDGPSLDVFADRGLLDVRARLALFRHALEGVAYAHRRGVVHRDLKPSNILVGTDGVPKLVDFGIARLLRPDEGPGTETTRTGQRMLTPEYASPEQIRGEPVDVRSDVYSLGVLLYRLLTGRPPYTLDSTRPGGAARVVCEEPPTRPSDAATRRGPGEGAPAPSSPDAAELARLRSSTGDGLRRVLRGDLDTLVLHALAKEPERRYATAAAFADDIDRYLEGRPIRARSPSLSYRARRFVGRRRLPLAAASAVVLGVSVAVWQASEAQAQRREAAARSAELTGLVGTVLTTLNTDVAGVNDGPTATRVAAVEAAVAALDTVAARVPGDPGPDLLQALGRAYQEVGILQGHPGSSNVGRVDDARESFERAIGYWERLAAADGGRPTSRAELAETRVLLSDILRTAGENERVADLLHRAEATMDSILAEAEPSAASLSVQAMVYERQMWRTQVEGDLVATGAYVERIVDLTRRIAERSPPGPARLATLEEVVLSLQYESFLESRVGDLDAAIATQLEAVRLADSIAAFPGATQRITAILAGAWDQLGWRYNDADRPDEAVAAFDRALALMWPILEADPRNQGAVGSIGAYLAGRGQAHIRGERWDEALADHREVIETMGRFAADMPTVEMTLAQSWRQMGEALSHLGRYDEAEEAYDEAMAGNERLFRTDTSAASTRKIMALAHYSQALHHRLRAQGTGDAAACARALDAEARGLGLWEGLRGQGLVFPGEERIWSDFSQMMPEGVCPPVRDPAGEGGGAS